MEHIKIFNSVNEKDNFIDASSFKYDIVGLVKNVEGVVYNPPEEIIHSYVVSNVRYISSVGFNSTANTVTWDYTVDKTTRSGKRVTYDGTDSQEVTYPINSSINDVTISGQITKYEVNIPYSFTQESGQGSYLTFVPREDGTFSFDVTSSSSSLIQYSVDNGTTWVSLEDKASTPTVLANQKIMWKGTLTAPEASFYGIGIFSSTCDFDARGNIMSLIYGDSFSDKTTIKDDGQFQCLFSGTSVIDTSGMVLPATTLKQYCYSYMFEQCKKIEKTIIELPSSTVPYRAYQGMFRFCDSLKVGPLIKAISFDEQAMSSMFRECTNLETIPSYSGTVTSIGSGSHRDLFLGCTKLTRGIDLTCANFGGNFGQNYEYMFSGCTSLNYIRCLISTPNTARTHNWTVGVARNGTFVRKPNVEWPRGTSGVPDGWTIVDDE